MKLDRQSLDWAITHLSKEGDTDLFPKPIEIQVINEVRERVLNALKNVDLGTHQWSGARRFIIPKSELSYRVATQLDPIDSIMLAAIIYQFGQLIEKRRIPTSENRVFSYRFSPTADGSFYGHPNPWSDFWKTAREKAEDCKYVVQLDIADFYNQIYHHVIENQLIHSGFSNEIKGSIMRLAESVTQTVSRGIPVGPHSMHLIAEMTLIPVDESLSTRKYDFCRYVDDILIFCEDEEEAQVVVYEVAGILDKQQRLLLQKEKTKICESNEFINYCDRMLTDNPINEIEEDLVRVINKHSSGDRYAGVDSKALTEEEMELFSKTSLDGLLEAYLSQEEPDYSRLRWFYRRLSQIGIPHAIEFSIKNLQRLVPALGDVCRYFISATETVQSDWAASIGDYILKQLDMRLIKSNEFFQITLLNLFVNSAKLNHVDKLVSMYRSSSENLKRKIILAAYTANAVSWLRELKEDYPRLDPWTKRALLIASTLFPTEERSHYLRYIRRGLNSSEILEAVLIEWALR